MTLVPPVPGGKIIGGKIFVVTVMMFVPLVDVWAKDGVTVIRKPSKARDVSAFIR